MRIIRTAETLPNTLSAFDAEMAYNGLDCCVTLEVYNIISQQLDHVTRATYEFSRDLQAPVLEMKLRGVLVDQTRRVEVLETYYEELDRLETQLEKIVVEGVGLDEFNWRSPAHLKALFYDALGIPPIRSNGRVTVDQKARDRLNQYLFARPLLNHLNRLADLGKKISFLKTGIDTDGRIRTSYNIAGTNTGRFSSSVSEFGTGGNLQNIEDRLRSVLIADPGMKFAKFDAKSGESFCVGAVLWNLFGDGKYLDAVESGDLHTSTARLCWPRLDWTGDLHHDKAVAETPFYRHHTYRQVAKKLGHASNYAGTPPTISLQTAMPLDIVNQFQPLYFSTYPLIPEWWRAVERQVREHGYLINLAGRKRYFMGRRNDPETLRGAIAYDPQGSLANIVNTGMLRVWRADIAQLMMQDHDAITVQYPEHLEDDLIPQIKELLTVPVQLKSGRTMVIPYDCKVGWNKSDFDEKRPERNPDGLREYTPGDTRRRQPQVSILDRVLR